jgi:glutamate formiminotransferase / formiminotetrahydrofolate cyclodeaminase
MGAFLNVRINAAGLKDREYAEAMIASGAEIERKAIELETEILTLVNSRMDQ